MELSSAWLRPQNLVATWEVKRTGRSCLNEVLIVLYQF